MGSQEECLELDASARTRILTPSPEGLLSSHEASMVESKKRKRDKSAMEDLLGEPFVVKPYPSTVFSKPYTLGPVALIPRMHVPISCLDILSPLGPLPSARLFEAHVKVLEFEERVGNTPTVLIAQCCDWKSIFVVERAEQNLYAICKLGSWVRLDRLCAAAIISRPQPSNVASSCEIGSVPSEDNFGPQVTPESSKYSKKKRLAIEAIQSMFKRPSKDGSSTPQDEAVPCCQAGTTPESQALEKPGPAGPENNINARPMAAEIFDNIQSQYFEALYLSKASLAYFAKGPLSRARATFHLDYDSTLDMNELIGFLEGLILPTAVVDKKYRDSVPNFLSSLMPDGSTEDGSKSPHNAKKPRKKKLKPGKDGLYPTEHAYLCQWWSSYDTDAEKDPAGGSKEDIMRNRVAQLRIRETQLQIIVVLETLALQSLATSPIDQSGELPSIGTSDGKPIERTRICSNSKRPLDLTLLIEVNIDRLCIWQSVAAEDGGRVSKLQKPFNIGQKPSSIAGTHDHGTDLLREFCIEVIVPFFSARLPEQCGTICKKLGGPVVVSPVRPKSKASAALSATSYRPIGVTKRSVPSKARRSLRRVLTDERLAREGSRGASGAVSLTRSATAPTIPVLKRERSETPLHGIPPAESQPMLISRGGILKSKNLSQREIDLSSLATVNDAKLKKASIEAELKDAISALKKPNRQLAGQLQVEAERRAASTLTHSRKSKKPVRNPSFQGVQILSTPKGNRGKYLAAGSRPVLESDPEKGYELDFIAPSSLPRIPLFVARASTVRESEKKLFSNATPVRPENKTNLTISGTPSHAQKKSHPHISDISPKVSSQNRGRFPPSPLQARNSSEQQFLDMPISFSPVVDCTPSKVVAVRTTPIKQRLNFIETDARFDPPDITIEGHGMDDMENNIKYEVQRGKKDDSIYKSLGWDDYDELI